MNNYKLIPLKQPFNLDPLDREKKMRGKIEKRLKEGDSLVWVAYVEGVSLDKVIDIANELED